MKANGYDIVKMSASAEGKALIDEANKSTNGDDFKKYLSDKCGIADDDTTGDTTPVDTSRSTRSSGGSSVSTLVDFGEGEAAINKFLDFYELGTGATLTSDQRSCLVAELVGSVTGDDLNQAAAGNASDDLVAGHRSGVHRLQRRSQVLSSPRTRHWPAPGCPGTGQWSG